MCLALSDINGFTIFFPATYKVLFQASNLITPPSMHSPSISPGCPRYRLIHILYCSFPPLPSFSTSISCSPVVCILAAASPISHCLWDSLITSSHPAQAFQMMDYCSDMYSSWSEDL